MKLEAGRVLTYRSIGWPWRTLVADAYPFTCWLTSSATVLPAHGICHFVFPGLRFSTVMTLSPAPGAAGGVALAHLPPHQPLAQRLRSSRT